MLQEFEMVRTQFILLTFENKSFSPVTISAALRPSATKMVTYIFYTQPSSSYQYLLGCQALQQLPDFENF